MHRSLSLRARLAFTLVAGVAGSLLIAGCGVGSSAVANDVVSAASFGGKINGGPNPVKGATVKLFTTGGSNGVNLGYGVGQFVQEASTAPGHTAGYDTDANGAFSFAGGYPCPAGQFLYLVASGGNTGNNTYNAKAYMVAALGRCEDLFAGNGQFTGGFIYLNELTTVAAAYALGNFSTVTGQGGFAQIGIGAPATNNASVGCVANGSTCPTTSAAGLRHAFENAINLVNPFNTQANATLPNNSAALVPQQMINTIANTVVACVNSDGSSNACQVLFGATGTDFTTSNTFQALVNLAKNPTLLGTPYSTSDFVNAATPQTQFYQPFLASPPPDFSISITYPQLMGATTGVQGLKYPVSGGLDINDNYYIGNFDAANATKSNVLSLQSNGSLVSFTPDDPIHLDSYGVSPDALGNLYTVGYTPLPTRGGGSVSAFSVDATSGTITTPTPNIIYVGTDHPISAAVDRANNLWFGSTTNPIIAELSRTQGLINIKGYIAPVSAVSVDPDQNIWFTTSSTSPSNAVNVMQNIGTLGSPNYSTSNILSASLPSLSASGISFVAGSPFTAYVANSQSTAGFTTVTPTVAGAEVTAVNVGTHVTGGSGPANNMTDGNGTVWAADNADVAKYLPTSSTVVQLTPCVYASGTGSCAGVPYSGINTVAIDAAGSVWFLSPGSGTASEMIGAAAPTWPLLSLGTLGKP